MNKRNYAIIFIIFILLFIMTIFISLIPKPSNIELFSNNNDNSEKTERFSIGLDPNLQLGNFLSCYFYNMAIAFLHNKNYETTYTVSEDSKSFTKHLPLFVPLDQNIKKAFKLSGITVESLSEELKQIDDSCLSAWNVLTKERETFWTIMKPLANRILKEALEKANLNRIIDSPVIHYRCSDVPFVISEYYHFQKYEYFKNTLTKIKEQTGIHYNKVYICYCNTHNTDGKKQLACDAYSSSLISYLEKNGYEVSIKCNTIDEDFATLFYAPAVIGTSGSFSFMASFFSDCIFFSSMYDERMDRHLKNSSGWLINDYTLKHSEVDDYYNTKVVIKSLYSETPR